MSKKIIITGNDAVGNVAYKFSEINYIYPISPSSEMADIGEKKASNKELNVFNAVPKYIEMQSEAGVAGAMHGALISGSLSTAFTCSQGLLLMIPNMYKIAGEMLPGVIHVASRTLATHALNISCDHSDILATKHTG
jgi:pyruvate-ferredoxin/flavodoxin oxidoreductase